MSQEQPRRKRGRPIKGETVMTAAERQAARMRRLKQAEATLNTAKTAALMVYKWADELQMSLSCGQPWQVQRAANELQRSVNVLRDILCR